jgi:hypothetical protein
LSVARTGSVTCTHSYANSGSFSVSIPADATVLVVGVAGSVNSPGYFSDYPPTIGGGGNIMSVGNQQDDDTPVSTTDYAVIFYFVNPPTGSQTLAYNWGSSYTIADGGHIVTAFYKGVDTSNPIRSSGGEQSQAASPDSATTGSLTGQSGDMFVGMAYSDDENNTGSTTWTNATELTDDLAQGTNTGWTGGSLAEQSLSGNVTVTATTTHAGSTCFTSLAGMVLAQGGYTITPSSSIVYAYGTTGVIAVSPSVSQSGYRWRNDNGAEDTATWLADQDTASSIPIDTTVRLRIGVDTDIDTDPMLLQLEYRKQGETQWRKVYKP